MIKPLSEHASSFGVGAGYSAGGELGRIAHEDAPPATGGSTDRDWMRLALATAMTGCGRANPNPSVGCAIVRDGALLATGATETYGDRHAERVAIDAAGGPGAVRGADIYVTLEPCANWGRQPPCADLVASAGFRRCIVAVEDPHPDVSGMGFRRVSAAGTEIVAGLLRNEAIAWHAQFILSQLLGRPVVGVLAGELALTGSGGDEVVRYRRWLVRHYGVYVVRLSQVARAVRAAAGPWSPRIVAFEDGWDAEDSGADASEHAPDAVLCVGNEAVRRARARGLGDRVVAVDDDGAPGAWVAAWLADGGVPGSEVRRVTGVLVDQSVRLFDPGFIDLVHEARVAGAGRDRGASRDLSSFKIGECVVNERYGPQAVAALTRRFGAIEGAC